jgi:hypothetical protein
MIDNLIGIGLGLAINAIIIIICVKMAKDINKYSKDK